MTPDGEEADAGRRARTALARLTERVRDVRDLEAFEVTRRRDGRFRCRLGKPVVELSSREALEAADALEELAAEIRRTLAE